MLPLPPLPSVDALGTADGAPVPLPPPPNEGEAQADKVLVGDTTAVGKPVVVGALEATGQAEGRALVEPPHPPPVAEPLREAEAAPLTEPD